MPASTVEEQILEYVLEQLETIPDVTATRSRKDAFALVEGVCVTVQPEDQQPEDRTIAFDLVMRDFTFVVITVVRGDPADQIADPVRVQVQQLLMADRTLGNLVAILKEHSTRWDFEAADGTAAALEQRFTARYQTRATDLTKSV